MNDISSSELINFKFPAYSEIPDVGLFLEQTAKYVNGYISCLGNVSLTTSMISNYVKKGIIANPIKKQYYRDQIAYIIFIAVAKTVLSLEDIQVMLALIPKFADCERAYKLFCDEFEKSLKKVFSKGELKIDATPVAQESAEIKLLKNTVIAVTNKVYLDFAFASIRNEMNEEVASQELKRDAQSEEISE